MCGQKEKLLLINNPIESESEYLADSNSLKDYDHAIFVRIIFKRSKGRGILSEENGLLKKDNGH